MALKTIRNYNKLIAVVFAASVLAVTACDVLCSIDRPGSMVMRNSSNSSSDKHHHQHDESHTHHANAKDVTGHTHSSSSTDKDDDCCKDVTNQFYKSLFNNTSSLVSSKAPIQSFILLVAISNYSLLHSQRPHIPFTGLLKVPPNSAGNYIRILISSFLI